MNRRRKQSSKLFYSLVVLYGEPQDKKISPILFALCIQAEKEQKHQNKETVFIHCSRLITKSNLTMPYAVLSHFQFQVWLMVLPSQHVVDRR